MANAKTVPFIGGSYNDDNRAFSVQECVNYLPVVAESAGTRSVSMLRTPPGMRNFARITHTSEAGDEDGPHRGFRNVEGRLFAVIGASLYEIKANGTYTRLGKIPGRSRVGMSHNKVENGNQVMIVNGSAGFIYDTASSTFSTITDPGFPGGICVDYIDSMFLVVDPQRRYIMPSALNNGLAWDTTERVSAEASPDRLRVAIVSHQQVLGGGERTTQVYQSTGLTTELLRDTDAGIERGFASTFCAVNLDNSVFFVGDDGIVYRMDGYTPIRISKAPIEQALARCDLSKCFAFIWEDRGHKVYYLTCPDGHTWGYDCATREWHRRQSKGLDRWQVNTLVKWNGAWYAGSFANGQMWRLDWDWQAEGDYIPADEEEETEAVYPDELISERTGPVYAASQNLITFNQLELVFDAGQPAPDWALNDHYCEIAISKNAGHTFGSYSQHSIGATGDFLKRVLRQGMGQSRQFVVRVRVSSPRKRDLMAASVL